MVSEHVLLYRASLLLLLSRVLSCLPPGAAQHGFSVTIYLNWPLAQTEGTACLERTACECDALLLDIVMGDSNQERIYLCLMSLPFLQSTDIACDVHNERCVTATDCILFSGWNLQAEEQKQTMTHAMNSYIDNCAQESCHLHPIMTSDDKGRMGVVF